MRVILAHVLELNSCGAVLMTTFTKTGTNFTAQIIKPKFLRKIADNWSMNLAYSDE